MIEPVAVHAPANPPKSESCTLIFVVHRRKIPTIGRRCSPCVRTLSVPRPMLLPAGAWDRLSKEAYNGRFWG